MIQQYELTTPPKLHRSNIFIRIFLLVGGVILLTFSFFIGWTLWQTPDELHTPLSESVFTQTEAVPLVEDKIVYGFLPFWLASDFQLSPQLTHLALFSLTLTETGEVQTRSGLSLEPGYRFFQSEQFENILAESQASGVNTDVVLTMFNNEHIEQFLTSTTAQQTALSTIEALILANSIDGINIDIEYSGEKSAEIRDHYTQFIVAVDQMLEQQFPTVKLSIDVYPSAIEKQQLWDITALESHVDYIIVMAYDFYRANSSISGPVAPLLSTQDRADEKNITYYIAKYLQTVPKQKIILGIPFYGYEWQTTENELRSTTYPRTGLTASFKRVQSILQNEEIENLNYVWEEDTLSPFITFNEGDKIKTISYENEVSLGYKLDFVQQAEIGGIAIWALGYEGENSPLWDVIDQKLPASDK